MENGEDWSGFGVGYIYGFFAYFFERFLFGFDGEGLVLSISS